MEAALRHGPATATAAGGADPSLGSEVAGPRFVHNALSRLSLHEPSKDPQPLQGCLT